MSKGNCRAADPEVFFCSDEEHPKLELTVSEDAVITAYCSRCPVRMQCLEYALDDAKIMGIWGGTTTAIRKTMRRTRKRSSCLRCKSYMLKTIGRVQVCRGCGLTWRCTL